MKPAIKVLFVCHGNICRSPMAEYIFLKMVKDARMEKEISVWSRSTSTEEIGNGIYPAAKRELGRRGIPVGDHRAMQMTKKDYKDADYVIGMDSMNIRNLMRMTLGDPDGKVYRLMEFCEKGGDVDDPWYTGEFSKTFDLIYAGCEGLLEKLKEE